jgi:hypothetical protein
MASKQLRRKHIPWLWIISVIFLLGSLILIIPSGLRISPDETANAFFSELFADTGSFSAEPDDLALTFNDRIHPRSAVSVNGVLKPGSFLGLPLIYGIFSAILGSWVLWIITPLVALIAAFAWRELMSRIVTKQIATISAILFLIHPALWYYSARSMMHNVLFVSLLVIGAHLLINNKRYDIYAGLLIALALMVRTSEIWWVLSLLVIGFGFLYKKLGRKRALLTFTGLAFGLLLLLGANTLTYGSPLTTGYTAGQTIQTTDLLATESLDAVGLFPFGIHPRTAWENVRDYGVSMFWWLSILALFGAFIFLSDKKKRRVRVGYVATFTLISAWLTLMYGSWEIHDNPDWTQVTMANSYVRYWLPMYLMSTLFIAVAVAWIGTRGRTKLAKNLIIGTLMIAVIGLNIHATFIQGQDGLLSVRNTLIESEHIQSSVLAHTEANALIVVDRADKLFFPHRRVMYPLRSDETYDSLPLLAQSVPVYYYGISFPEEDFEYLNESRLGKMGLVIELVEEFELESLYKISVGATPSARG